MTTKHVISLSMVVECFKGNTNLIERGENSYNSGYVINMVFDPDTMPATLKGIINASMKKRSYNVEILVDPVDGIIDAKCTCPRGLAVCHHMAALCIYAHHNVSVTDKACAWNVSKPTEELITKKLKALFPLKENYCPIESTDETDIVAFKNKMLQTNVGFSWLLRPTPPQSTLCVITNIEDILFSEDYNKVENKSEYIAEKCQISKEHIARLKELTVGQGDNENWLLARKLRLTGSKFGMVLAACERGKFPPSLFTNLMEGYDLSNVQAVQWGKLHEKVAIEHFENVTTMKVTPAGFCLHPCGYIGVSPDGFIDDDSIIEVKCPFKYRDISLQDALKVDKSYIILKTENNDVIINQEHVYWHQIQGALHITGTKWCFLVIWTPAECEIVKVSRDEDWIRNIKRLQDFYLNKFVPFVIGY